MDDAEAEKVIAEVVEMGKMVREPCYGNGGTADRLCGIQPDGKRIFDRNRTKGNRL
jgi:hypothetical protein